MEYNNSSTISAGAATRSPLPRAMTAATTNPTSVDKHQQRAFFPGPVHPSAVEVPGLKTAQLRKHDGPCGLCHQRLTLEGLARRSLNEKYMTRMEAYNAKVINDIVYNENTHIVSVFKDYLVYDDISEFMKRFYAGFESATRLPKVYDFYEKYSKVFPNYVVLPENKFMFKNIERKQRVIDEHQDIADNKKKEEEKKSADSISISDNRILTKNFIKELDKPDPTMSRAGLDLSDSRPAQETLMMSYIRESSSKVRGPSARIEEMGLSELIDKFLSKDSLSIINVTGKTIELDAEVSRKDPPRQTVNPAPIPKPRLASRIIHIRAKSESTAPKPAAAKNAASGNRAAKPKLNLHIVMKDLAQSEQPSPGRVPTQVFHPALTSSRNSVPSVQAKTQRAMRTNNKPGSPVRKSSKLETKDTTVRRAQSIGKRRVQIVGENARRMLSSERTLPAVDTSPMGKRDLAVIQQKYASATRVRVEDPSYKGDFGQCMNAALRDLKNAPPTKVYVTHKAPGPHEKSAALSRSKSECKLHGKKTSADLRGISPQRMDPSRHTQRQLVLEPGSLTGRNKPRVQPATSRTVRHIEQMYLQHRAGNFRSEYLNSLKSKQQQPQVGRADTVAKWQQPQPGLGYSRSIGALPAGKKRAAYGMLGAGKKR